MWRLEREIDQGKVKLTDTLLTRVSITPKDE